MTNLNDFINKKKEVKELNDKKQKIEGSFACQQCSLYSTYALMDQSGNIEWQCLDGHMSYGRV